MFAYDLKKNNTYTFRTLDELDYLIRKEKYNIPVSRDISPLARKAVIHTPGNDVTLANSITVHPMEGFDGSADGSPTELTERRYLRFASSGASLVWSEACAVCPEGRTSDKQLMITEKNKDEYKNIISKMKAVADIPVIAQLTHSGRFSHNSNTPYPLVASRNKIIEAVRTADADAPLVTDDYLKSLPEKYAAEAKAATDAGFDGVDIKICHHYLLSELLSAFTREGIYGGSFENRTRLILEITDAVKAVIPSGTLICSRFGVSDMIAYPYGFGMDKQDSKKPDFTETFALLELLMSKGLSVIDMTMGSPYFNPHVNRPYNMGGYVPAEHPLSGVERIISGARAVKERFPSLFVIGTGYSYLKEFAPNVGSAVLESGGADAIGSGRLAFACPRFADDMINGCFNAAESCITCSKCTELMRAGGPTGCPIRDREIYLPIYKKICMHKA